MSHYTCPLFSNIQMYTCDMPYKFITTNKYFICIKINTLLDIVKVNLNILTIYIWRYKLKESRYKGYVLNITINLRKIKLSL